MKKLFLLFLSLSFSVSLFSQLNPISWSQEVISKGDNIYEIIISADLNDDWAIYSQHTAEGGPIPTSFEFTENKDISLEKGVREDGDVISGFDSIFEIDVKKFKKQVRFVQMVKLKSPESLLEGSVTYMVCNDLKCLPPTVENFSVLIK